MALPGEFPMAEKRRNEIVGLWRNYDDVLDERKIALKATDVTTGEVTVHFLQAHDVDSIDALGELTTHTFRIMSDSEVENELDRVDMETRIYGINPEEYSIKSQ